MFDSRAEATHYLRLKAEQLAGRISGLRCQVRFRLVVNGDLICRYVADFTLIRDGRREVIDVKGMVTREYLIKRKLMKALFGIDIIEVR